MSLRKFHTRGAQPHNLGRKVVDDEMNAVLAV